jgi:chemotaxis methyl-accepting protein methylase
MDRAVARAGRFRHVIFPDSVGGYGRAVNVARVARVGPADNGVFTGLGPACPRLAADVRWAFPPPAPAPLPADESGPLTGVDPASVGRDGGLGSDAESFLAGLFAHVGLGLRHYKPETLYRRLPACLRVLRATSLAHARSVLQRQPHLAPEAVDALVIGVTSFFRDPAVFDALRRLVLPDLIAHSRARRRPLRVWSAGCSDGAELYSVAMSLSEFGGAGNRCGGDDYGVELLGTDCRPNAVAAAAEGVYDPAAVAGVPPALLQRYFDFDGARYRVKDALRAAARWKVADVLRAADAPPGPFDLVLCRNVVIYLQPSATTSVWSLLARSLRGGGGVLVAGKAERPVGLRGLRPVAPCLYRRGVA